MVRGLLSLNESHPKRAPFAAAARRKTALHEEHFEKKPVQHPDRARELAEESREKTWALPSAVAELFMGKTRWEWFLPSPENKKGEKHGDPQTDKIAEEFLGKLRKVLLRGLDPDQVDETGQIPPEFLCELAGIGAFGMKIPREYGGLGLSEVNYGRAISMVASYCASTSVLLSAHQSIGVPQPLLLFGTEEQKRKYLPRIAKGAITAFALTEPDVGSDPARLSTTASRSADGKTYTLNGTKLWCTNGVIAELFVVMAKIDSPEPQAKPPTSPKITAFIVEKNSPGFEVLHRCRFEGLNGIQNALLRLNNVTVPAENILWGEGKGLKLALITLNAGRLSLPAGCIGAARQCLRIAREWGLERRQWGQPIGRHEEGSRKISSMAAHLFAMEAMTSLTANWQDHKSHDIRLEAALAKVFCSEHGFEIVDDTLQLRGGRGYERASSLKARGEKAYPVERIHRDARIHLIVEGTSEILRLYIARECLDRHLKIAGDALNSKLPWGRRALALVRAARFYSVWYPAQWLGALTSRFRDISELSDTPSLKKHVRYTSRTAHRLARTTFHLLLRYGASLEKRQLQLRRIVDITMDLFSIMASIAAAMERATPESLELVEHFSELATLRIERNFRAISRNCDRSARKLGNRVLDQKFTWMEKEIVISPFETPTEMREPPVKKSGLAA